MSLRFLVAIAVVLTALTAFSADTKLDLGSADRDTEYVTSVDHTSLANGNTKVLANQDGTVSIISGAGGTATNTVVTTATDKKAWYSECNTSGSPRVVTTTTGDFQLVDGAMITIYFKKTMSYDTTLNIDNTGAKSIWGSKQQANLSVWWQNGGQTATFVYSASRDKYIYMEDTITATTSRYGVVSLSSSTNSTLESSAATPKAVKMVADAIGAERTARLNAGYVTKSVTNGLAAKTWVDSHKWDWATQVTNKPSNVSAFNNDAGYVTANHTHSNLVNGTTQVIANQNGTASIVSAQSVQKPNCVRVSRADGPTTMVLSFRNTSDELESWGTSWPDQLEFTIEYDGVSYDAITVGESDSEGLREVSTSLSWANGSRIFPAGIYSSTYGTSWSGVLYDFESPRGLDIIGDGNGESCSTYTYIGETSINKTIATTDQIPAVPTLATVATTGSYNDLLNKPTIPAAQIQSDWNQTNTSAKDYIKNKPDIDSKLATKEDSILYTYDKTTTLPDGNYPAYVKAFCTDVEDYGNRLISGRVVIPPYLQKMDAFYEVSAISGITGSPTYGADGLLSVTTPTNVTSVGAYAFYGCTSLEFLELPGVTSIANYAFDGCYSLRYIDFGSKARPSVPTLGTDAFSQVPTSCKIIVPDSQLNAWKAATGWSALVTAGYQFMKHSDWEYVRRYELPTVPTNVSDFTNDANYVSASTATNIARAIISDAIANVNVNIQSAEDTRVALTNLITILKNL